MDDDDRYSWRKYCGAGYKYNVYPENYETPEEYEADLAHAIHEKGDEGKFASKSGDPAKNAGTGKDADVNRDTIYNRYTNYGRNTGAQDNSGSDMKEGTSADGQSRGQREKFYDGPFEFREIRGGLELYRYRHVQGIRELVIPGEVAGKKVLLIRATAFMCKKELESVTISEGIQEIGKNAFDGCAGLKEVILPSSLRIIQAYAFASCSQLAEIRFPQGLRKIDDGAFSECSGVKKVYIPNSVDDIGICNFWGYSSSKDAVIYCCPGSYAWKYAEINKISHAEPAPAFSANSKNTELEPEEGKEPEKGGTLDSEVPEKMPGDDSEMDSAERKASFEGSTDESAEPPGPREPTRGKFWNKPIKKPSNKAILIGCLIVIALCVAGVYIGRAITKHNNFVSFQNMVKEADELVPSSISEGFGEYEHVKEVTAEADSSVEWNDYYDWYTWTENFDIYVYVDDEIDDLTTLEKYEYIKAVGGRALNAAYSLIDDNFPTYSDYQSFLGTEDLTGHLISMTRDDDVYIMTSQNTYEYASNVKYYYVENGKDVFVRDSAGNWMGDKNYKSYSGSSSSGSSSGSSSSGSSSKSSSGSSSKRSSGSSGSDSLNASDYDHPEEFYEDNYPDFDGYEDAEVYWEDNH